MDMKVRTLYSLLLALAFIYSGCQDKVLMQSEQGTDAIAFALYTNGEDNSSFTPLTRSIEKPLVLVNEDGTDSLTFYLTITDTIDLGQSSYRKDSVITRGTPITQENLVSICSGKIALDSFYQDNPFIKDVILFNENGEAHTGITRYWPNNEGAKVAFWSYYPKEIAEATNFTISNGANPTLSFYYSQHGAEGKLMDVTQQKDLFFDYVYQGKEDGVVSLRYHHAVSAIKFVAGKTLAGTIQKIQLTNVYGGGTLNYTPNETPALSWILDESPSTLNQDFNVRIDENLNDNPSQAITSDDAGTTFLLIPQTVGGKELSVSIDRSGTSVTYSAPMPEGVWEMGKTYTYTLKLMDGLGIDASGEVKTDGVAIENTNKKTCYLRAMIIGNWVDAEGNVAAIFNPEEVDLAITSTNTNYQLASNWGNFWYYDAVNNLYYYKKPLPEGQFTEVKLFDQFTNPKDRTSEGLKLDFVVLVQAVEADADKASAKAAWGDGVAGVLE